MTIQVDLGEENIPQVPAGLQSGYEGTSLQGLHCLCVGEGKARLGSMIWEFKYYSVGENIWEVTGNIRQ